MSENPSLSSAASIVLFDRMVAELSKPTYLDGRHVGAYFMPSEREMVDALIDKHPELEDHRQSLHEHADRSGPYRFENERWLKVTKG